MKLSTVSDIADVLGVAFDLTNLSMLIYGSNRINKALKRQNSVAVALMTTGIVVSVSNTLWIIHKVKQNSEGAKLYDIPRANGKSRNNRDGSGHH